MPRSAHLSREQLIDRQAFQIALIDRLRGLDNPHALLAAAAEMLGERLQAGRCGVAAITADGLQVRVDADWSGSLPSLAGEARLLDSFGPEVIAELRTGQTLVVEDSDTDPRVRDHAAGWASIQTRALIVVPILREGRLEGVFYVHDGAPRSWTLSDISLVEDVALRTREATDRRSEEHTSELQSH